MQTDKAQPALERRLRDQRNPSELKAINPQVLNPALNMQPKVNRPP